MHKNESILSELQHRKNAALFVQIVFETKSVSWLGSVSSSRFRMFFTESFGILCTILLLKILIASYLYYLLCAYR